MPPHPPTLGDHRRLDGGGARQGEGEPESLPKRLGPRRVECGEPGRDPAAPARAEGRTGKEAHLLAPSILSAPRLHVIWRVSSLTWKVFRSGRCDFLE
jgi:hypothetical protein